MQFSCRFEEAVMRTIQSAKGFLVSLGLLVAAQLSGAPIDILDTFDSGNDAAWTHLEPLASSGAPGTFSFPNGAYRIQASKSPDPTTLGPARAGSLRYDTHVGIFNITIDLVGFDASLNQSFGLLGRVTSPGFGTTSGYALTYSTAGSINLSSFQGEQMTLLDSVPAILDPTHVNRFTLAGFQTGVAGVVRDLDNQTGGGVSAADVTHPLGLTGLFVMSNVGDGTADATFDNYHAVLNVPEPSTWSLLVGGAVTFYMGFRRRSAIAREQPQSAVPCCKARMEPPCRGAVNWRSKSRTQLFWRCRSRGKTRSRKTV